LRFLIKYKLTFTGLVFFALIFLANSLFRYSSQPFLQGKITSSSRQPYKNQGPENLLTGFGTWHAQLPLVFPQWIQIQLADPRKVTQLGMQSQSNSPGGNEHRRAPKDFSLQGSQDGKTWVTLKIIKNNTFSSGGERKFWEFKNKNAYSYYRIHITAGDNSEHLTIQQVQLN